MKDITYDIILQRLQESECWHRFSDEHTELWAFAILNGFSNRLEIETGIQKRSHRHFWNLEKAITTMRLCKKLSIFTEHFRGGIDFLRSHGLHEQAISESGIEVETRKRCKTSRGYWVNLDNCIDAIIRNKGFKGLDGCIMAAIKKHGHLKQVEDATGYKYTPRKPNGYYTLENCAKEIEASGSFEKAYAENSSLEVMIRKHRWCRKIEEITGINSAATRRTQRKLERRNLERIEGISKQYTMRSAFRKNHKVEAEYLDSLGLFDKFCSHMPKGDTNASYCVYFLYSNASKLGYVGLCAESNLQKRIASHFEVVNNCRSSQIVKQGDSNYKVVYSNINSNTAATLETEQYYKLQSEGWIMVNDEKMLGVCSSVIPIKRNEIWKFRPEHALKHMRLKVHANVLHEEYTWDHEALKEGYMQLTQDFTSIMTFKDSIESGQKIYEQARGQGWLIDLFGHIRGYSQNWKKRLRLKRKRIIKAVRRSKSYSDLSKHHQTAYQRMLEDPYIKLIVQRHFKKFSCKP